MTIRIVPATLACAASLLVAGVVTGATTGTAAAQQSQALKEIPADKAKLTGAMTVDYNSRSARSTSGIDLYEISDLSVADLMILKGTVQRTPGKSLVYSVKFDVLNPSNPSQIAREVAILRGDLQIDNSGRYIPDAGRLRIDVVKGNQSTSAFGGSIQGRNVVRWWEVGEQIRKAQKEATKIYSRVVDGKTVSIQVKNPDPLRFERTQLAAGPFSFLPETRVSGNLDYDYELGNWLTDANGVSFSYAVADRSFTDRVSGSIRFVEENGTFSDKAGKKKPYTGYYEYNLRWNEQPANTDQSFFDAGAAQAQSDAFFSAADQSKPGLYGRVYYNDSEDACRRVKGEDGKDKCVGPTRSEVTWDLKAEKLTYAQLANWVKLEQLILGPLTDE
ncbi:hypothetical protein [Xanthobacter versatilis]|uniref:Uncharacterized protein n=1 Tax=Xanthobacter autotrophicus (strain ATCC BAA-1158 / Py2) TaxID=78245 RepID=A7IB65_XANP2|nr:hypothetical protein Xaut_4455 [Xanthobacter autotrophicus Py2]